MMKMRIESMLSVSAVTVQNIVFIFHSQEQSKSLGFSSHYFNYFDFILLTYSKIICDCLCGKVICLHMAYTRDLCLKHTQKKNQAKQNKSYNVIYDYICLYKIRKKN